MCKYDTAGNLQWVNGAGGNDCDEVGTVTCDSVGDIFISGIASSSISVGGHYLYAYPGVVFIAKYNSNGNVLWAKLVNDSCAIGAPAISAEPLGNLYGLGSLPNCPVFVLDTFTINYQPYQYSYFGKIKSSTVGIDDYSVSQQITVFPNPFSMETIIRFSEYQINTHLRLEDIDGRIIQELNFSGSEYQFSNNNFKPGIYFLNISDSNNNIRVTKKLLVY
jgi:hypothetical protein